MMLAGLAISIVRASATEADRSRVRGDMQSLSSVHGLVVSQQKEWGEILTGFETRNRYLVRDTSGNTMYIAGEEGGSILLRWFLKALRPFTIIVLTEEGQPVLRMTRGFRFYFHRLEVSTSQGSTWVR